ncbi:ABC transporter ATP-binding protein [Halomicrococcus sp. SG-WS-1]|uniref:ABC transporter ATP-binding protein n=1 Tax=Halomicrococcus sp. SG-WS-1 TaxID=3439057 RepID=UPI003F79ED88
MTAIEVRGLSKRYGDVLANDDLSFSVAEGEVFGYLGPNGAGKTTTIRTLMGFQSPTSGSATVLGSDVRDERELIEAKRRVGYLPADPAFDETATGREILDLHAAVKGDERREELLDIFDPPLDREVREYSSGNNQMLGLVQAFMHDPDLVVLDEPTGGLDPLKQQEFNEFVRRERATGTTVFMSSHILSEVRRVCDRVGVIRDGRLVTTESVERLLRRSGKVVHLTVTDDVGAGEFDLDGVHDLAVRQVDGETVEGEANGGSVDGAGKRETSERTAVAPTVTELSFTFTGNMNALVDRIHDYDVLELDVQEAPLEEVFMRFYGDESAEAAEVPPERRPGDGGEA